MISQIPAFLHDALIRTHGLPCKLCLSTHSATIHARIVEPHDWQASWLLLERDVPPANSATCNVVRTPRAVLTVSQNVVLIDFFSAQQYRRQHPSWPVRLLTLVSHVNMLRLTQRCQFLRLSTSISQGCPRDLSLAPRTFIFLGSRSYALSGRRKAVSISSALSTSSFLFMSLITSLNSFLRSASWFQPLKRLPLQNPELLSPTGKLWTPRSWYIGIKS